MAGLTSVPPEIWIQIVRFLGMKDLISLLSVSGPGEASIRIVALTIASLDLQDNVAAHNDEAIVARENQANQRRLPAL